MLSNRPKVLITGATGFVGKQLCQYFLTKGLSVKGVGRKLHAEISHPHFEYYWIESIDDTTQWGTLLDDVDVVVHLAARVHQRQDKGMRALTEYQRVNVKGTQQLARAAVKSDVRRFIYISSIKVNGEKTVDMSFRAEDQPQPQNAYSLSKLQAEQILQEESRRSGMEWVIIRPPLIYGPNVKGNFRCLLKLAKMCLPLPFASVNNRRSLVSIYNLCNFIECCLTHPHATGEVFLVSDNEDLSTARLIKFIRQAYGKRAWLFPVPLILLKLLGYITGQSRQWDRLLSSLQVNIEKSQRLLNWQPIIKTEDAIKALCESERAPLKTVWSMPFV